MKYSTQLIYQLNTSKHTLETLAHFSGITEERLTLFIEDKSLPQEKEQSAIAKVLKFEGKGTADDVSDLDKGIKILKAEQSSASGRTIYRGNDENRIPYYFYRDLVVTSVTEHCRGELLDILCTEESKVVQNRGHLQDALTIITKGPIKGYWTDKTGRNISKKMELGHSYFARGFLPHTYRSMDENNIGQIISFTFTQNLVDKVKEQLTRLGERSKLNIPIESNHGSLLKIHLNNSMLSVKELAERSGIQFGLLNQYLSGERIPELEVLNVIAETLNINLEDLMPILPDSEYGAVHLTSEESVKTRRFIRNSMGETIYEVYDLARSREASHLRGHRIVCHKCTKGSKQAWLFSTEHTVFFVLSGKIELTWEYNSILYSKQLEEYDSFYVEPFLRLKVLDVDDNKSQILRFQYPSNVAGSPRKELFLKGVDNIERIVSDRDEWSPNQSRK